MARIQSVSLNEAEGKGLDTFLETHKEFNMNQLIKKAIYEFLEKYSTGDHIPAHIQRLMDDLETWQRWKYSRSNNVTWLTGRHGVTAETAEKAVDQFMKAAIV